MQSVPVLGRHLRIGWGYFVPYLLSFNLHKYCYYRALYLFMPESSRLELCSCLLSMLESGASGGSAAPTVIGTNNSTSISNNSDRRLW